MAERQTKRLLVVANKTCPCSELHAAIANRYGRVEVLVVAPALNSRVRHWVSDTDEAVRAATARLALAVSELEARGIPAQGQVGDADPLLAIADALVRFAADEILISTHPPGHSNWLENDLIERAHERFEAPVTHVVSSYGIEPGRHATALA